MTSGNKEHLEALSPRGKLYPLNLKDQANPLSLVTVGVSKKLSAYQWQYNGVQLEKRCTYSRLRVEGIFKTYSLNFQEYNYCRL